MLAADWPRCMPMGLTFNMISLFALIIHAWASVVDDAIVVGEHADWRAKRELGEAPAEAARTC